MVKSPQVDEKPANRFTVEKPEVFTSIHISRRMLYLVRLIWF